MSTDMKNEFNEEIEKCAICGDDTGRCEKDIQYCIYCGKGPLCDDCCYDLSDDEIDDYLTFCMDCFSAD